MNISKITLGTAQLGLNYGISNINRKPNMKTAIDILNFSFKKGINSFDTSPSYGNSEKIIGSFISSQEKKDLDKIIIISKLPAINLKEEIFFDSLYKHIKEQINESLYNLKIKTIPFYLLHNAPDIFIEDGLVIECLDELSNEGMIEKFGISGYNPEEVKASLRFKSIKVIQIPINIFDHRLIKTGLLKKLKEKDYIILARSIYLQGLFFLHPKKLPDRINSAEIYLKKLNKFTEDLKISIAKLAFLFVRDLPEITSLVIGAEKKQQIIENLDLLKEKPLTNEVYNAILDEFNEIPQKIINPSLWI